LNSSQKIALVCGHFIPNLGYIEVYLAKKMAQQNFDVCVFTSNKIPAYVSTVADLNIEENAYQVKRLPAQFSKGQMVWSNNLTAEIKKFNPDKIIVIGVGKLFPYPVYKKFKHKEIITLFGDNVHNYNLKSGGMVVRFKQKILDKIKNKVYRKALKISNKLIGYTPETEDLLLARFPEFKAEIQQKYRFVSLGFDDEIYYLNNSLREKTRNELAIDQNTLVGITVTRFNKNKQIEKIVDFVGKLNQYQPVKYILLGAANDAYSKQIEQLIEKKKLQETIILLPFEKDKSKINALYNAADFGIWTQPAISVIEAKGTGLPVFLPREKSMQHLTLDNTGLFYTELDNIFAQKCLQFMTEANRKQIANKNQWLNYREIVQQILNN
tara:strand:- start:54517 stop:55662 length:1146 start_codon:yes stop_codon:yes gene_type:complete